MNRPHTAETRERVRVLVETTLRASEDIAAETGTSEATVRRWTRLCKWKRPDGAAPDRRKIPEATYDAARRVYGCGARTEDIAEIARCSAAHVARIAAREGWRRDDPGGERKPGDPALGAALAEIEAALRRPDLGRAEFVRLVERAMALTAADAINGAAGVERTAMTLTRLAATAKSLPDLPTAPALHGGIAHPVHADAFPDANELIEEIARRFEQMSDEWIDPRILAILAETVA